MIKGIVRVIILFLMFPAAAIQAQQELDAIGDETVELFRKYLSINTTNPPENVAAAAEFLSSILEREGVSVELVWTNRDEGKAGVLARLKGSGDKKPLLLLNHIDVVPADREFRTVDPFAGIKKDGCIYGRGVLPVYYNVVGRFCAEKWKVCRRCVVSYAQYIMRDLGKTSFKDNQPATNQMRTTQ